MTRFVVALTSALLTLAVTAGTAQAAPAPTGFAAQARALGLSADEARTLQSRMDAHLARSGGTQISINTIELAGVGELIEPLPGELRARRVSASGDVSTMLSCLYLYFCAFSGNYYTGSVIDMYNCSPYSIPWSSSGSWKNNQTSGTRAKFYNGSGGVLFTTPGAYSEDAVYNWSPVYNVVPC